MSKRINPVPYDLKRRRRHVNAVQYGNFYGNIETKTGVVKRFSVKVNSSRVRNGMVAFKLIKHASGKFKGNQVPWQYWDERSGSYKLVKQGHVFSSWGDFLNNAIWTKVRRVRKYEAGMVYSK